MAFPFQGLQARRRNQIVAMDLGARTTKAVYVQRRGNGFEFAGFSILETPPPDRTAYAAKLGEHLKRVVQDLGARTKALVLAVGGADIFLRQTEMPLIPVADMRQMLKYNAKAYLQQELQDHVFDCHILPPPAGGALPGAKPGQKCRVLVSGAKRQLVADLQAAAKLAGLSAEMIQPGLVGAPNAFELAQPEAFAKEAVALVDLGYKNTTICALLKGELVMNRVVGIGAEKLTTGLAESLGVPSAEAETIKMEPTDIAQVFLSQLMQPLATELNASLAFFETQHDTHVGQVFVSGGSARSEFMVRTLSQEMAREARTWNPAGFMTLALPPQRLAEVEHVAPQLVVAIGAAMSAF